MYLSDKVGEGAAYNVEIKDLFDLSHTAAGGYLGTFRYPWQALSGISDFIVSLGKTLSPDLYDEVSPFVWLHKRATVAPTAYIGGPAIIGAGTEIRHCAFIRGGALVGENCVVGNSVELKNVILFDGVQVPHFNYVGDSILGFKAHMGAGAVTSNVKSDESLIVVKSNGSCYDTGLQKLGAMLGDFAEIGCNSVLNPGTVVGRRATVYPLSCVRGVVPEKCIWKTDRTVVAKK